MARSSPINRNQQAAHKKLAELSSGGGSLAEIAALLRSFPIMHIPTSASDAARDEEPAATAARDAAPLLRTTLDGERFPCVFTRLELAKSYAANNPQEPVGEFRESGWTAGLYDILIRKYGGVIIDAGSPHALTLSRTQAAYIYALLNAEEMLGRKSLHIITCGQDLLLQNANKRKLAYAYETYLAAQAGIDWLARALNDRTIEIAAQERPTVEVLSQTVAAGADILLVNAGLPDQHMYYREDLSGFLASIGRSQAVDPAETPQAETQGAELLEKARRAVTRPAVPATSEPDQAVSNRLSKLRSLIEQNRLEPWEFLQQLSELPLYVPVLPQRSYGLLWPTFWRSRKGGSFIAVCFARKAEMDREFADTAEAGYRSFRLSGIEALRWILATPAPFDHIGIDVGDGGSWLEFPAWWGLIPLFPLLAENERYLPYAADSTEGRVIAAASRRQSGTAASFASIVAAAAELLAAGKVSKQEAGALAAVVPRYWVAKIVTPANLDGTPLRRSEDDAIVLFTDQQSAVSFFERSVSEADRGKARVFPVLSGWENSALHLGEDENCSICINPGKNELLLDRFALEAALEKLSEILMPRVPDFVS